MVKKKTVFCKYCGHSMQSLSHGQSEGENMYCPKCKAHEYRGKWYSGKEWSDWINSEV